MISKRKLKKNTPLTIGDLVIERVATGKRKRIGEIMFILCEIMFILCHTIDIRSLGVTRRSLSSCVQMCPVNLTFVTEMVLEYIH